MKNILRFLEKSEKKFMKVSKTEFALAANIFESGPMHGGLYRWRENSLPLFYIRN